MADKLDLLLANEEELVVDVKVRSSLDCRDHAVFELRIQRGRSNAKSRTGALDLKRAEFGLFRDLLGRSPWVMVLHKGGV